jgi:hypothetical protein
MIAPLSQITRNPDGLITFGPSEEDSRALRRQVRFALAVWLVGCVGLIVALLFYAFPSPSISTDEPPGKVALKFTAARETSTIASSANTP